MERDIRELSGMTKMFSILVGVVVTQVNKFVKTHLTVLLKLQHDIICKVNPKR